MDISLRHEHRIAALPEDASTREQHQWERAHPAVPVWDADAGDGWTASITVQPGPEGQPLISEFRFWHPNPTQGGLTSTRLRAFHFGEFAQAIHRRYRAAPDPTNTENVGGQDVIVDPDDWIGFVTDSGFHDLDALATTPPPGPGRPSLPITELLQIAVLYVKALEDGAAAPIQVAAKALDEKPSYISDRVAMARERGILTPSPGKGFAGGHLTPKALELLQDLEAPKIAEDEGDAE